MEIAFILSAAMIGIAYLGSNSSPSVEKLATYECGFEAFSDSKLKFDVHFYLVAILFIIFDLEAAFLFPWAILFSSIDWFGYGSIMLFGDLNCRSYL
jgi:NADH-quinone oxidoreductase subunit A